MDVAVLTQVRSVAIDLLGEGFDLDAFRDGLAGPDFGAHRAARRLPLQRYRTDMLADGFPVALGERGLAPLTLSSQ